MNRRLSLFAFFVLLLVPRAPAAQYPLGSVALLLPSYAPSKLLADPVRMRVYAADPTTNSIVVIDTTTLKVIATVPIGSTPVDMAISLDGNTLYVANNGSTLAAIGVLDLNTLTVRPSYALPGSPLAVAAGLNGRLYASAVSNSQSTIYQLDGATGTMQATFNQNYYDNNLFQISPDGTRLFVASTGISYGTLKSFDVSTATPVALMTNSSASENDSQLVISHNGEYLCLPSGGGNPGAGNYTTFLFATADVTTHYGSFNNGAYPGPLAFSPDDTLVYQTRAGGDPVLDVFDTQSFFKLKEVSLPVIGSQGYPDTIESIVTDNTGSYLFISESSSSGVSSVGQLAVITTGTGTLTPPSVIPVITSSSSASATQNVVFTYQITADNTPTSFNATNLPTGLSVNTRTGLISGVPTVSGYQYATISATNASGTDTASLQFDITYSAVDYTPVITTSSLSNGVIGHTYTAQVAATNSPYSYSASGLPTGLRLNSSSGLISGTPSAAGTYNVTLSATNAYGTGTTTISLVIALASPVITSGTAANGQTNVPFAYQIVATNSPGSFTASNLPAGLNLNSATGLISGAPTVSGTFHLSLSATNAGGTGTSSLTLVVVAILAPVIISPDTASGTVGHPFVYQIAAYNNPTSFAASGLPTGLNIDTVTGLILGTPLEPGTYPITLNGINSGGLGSVTLTLTVAADSLVVTLVASTPQVTVGSGEIGAFTVSLSEAQDHDVVVNLLIKGTAVNGTDYTLLKTTKKIKAGKTSKPIKIIPQGDQGGSLKKVVTLVLAPGDGYAVGTTGKVKVKIINP